MPVGATDDESCRVPSGTAAIFQAASLAKPVVAFLTLRLVLRGLLDLDQPISELLPHGYFHRQNLFALRESPIVDEVPRQMLQKLTARTLLSHTSGLPNWSPKGPLQLSFEPGAQWQYSGEGFVLLQHVLHTLTGKPLQEFASVELFQPLGLKYSAFKITDQIAQSLVPGRSASGAIRQLRFPFEIAASSLYTTPSDYALFMSSLLADERLLSLVTHAPVPVPKAPNVFWGLGWGIERVSERSYIWHWGSITGFRSLAMADLNTKDAVVAFAAAENGMPLAKSRIRETLPGPHPGLELNLVQ
jgi:CubicO group peptidase (beta-lactamase class C family)